MIFIATILALASPADGVVKARVAYSTCLRGVIDSAMDKKTPAADVKASLKPACAAKEAAFRDAIAVADKSYGMSASEISEDADSQVSDYIDKMTDDYEDFLAHGL
ncbi:MAG: hypothetical protein ABI395_06445 [Sphingobium sp.]